MPTSPAPDAPYRGQFNPAGLATVLDAPPAPFAPTQPGEPLPKTAEQVEADRQFQQVTQFQGSVMNEVQALAERLRQTENGNFVSLYFDNDGDPSVVFQFLKNGPETLRQYTRHPRFIGKTVRWSQPELMAAADFMWKAFREDRVIQSTGIGRNEVDVEVSVSAADFRALVARKGVTIPEAVVLHFRAVPPVPLANPPRPASTDDVVPREIARTIRIFPRDDRVAGARNSTDSRVKVILKDGCFRAPEHGDALVLFPFDSALWVDRDGYLAFGPGKAPGYARVGETVVFMGSVGEVTVPSLVQPIHAACGSGKVIKVEGLESAAARDAQQAVSAKTNAIRSLRERYGLGDAQARQAYEWLEKRQAAMPRQRMENGTLAPPVPAWLSIDTPPRPIADPKECPAGTRLSFGICRTPEGYTRPLPAWLQEFLAQDR